MDHLLPREPGPGLQAADDGFPERWDSLCCDHLFSCQQACGDLVTSHSIAPELVGQAPQPVVPKQESLPFVQLRVAPRLAYPPAGMNALSWLRPTCNFFVTCATHSMCLESRCATRSRCEPIMSKRVHVVSIVASFVLCLAPIFSCLLPCERIDKVIQCRLGASRSASCHCVCQLQGAPHSTWHVHAVGPSDAHHDRIPR
jgi:hypothetical protein